MNPPIPPQRQWTMYSPPILPFVPAASLTVGVPVLCILGEAPGADEEKSGLPFTGASGRLLRKDLLPQAGLDIANFHLLNVFTQRPPGNDLKTWTLTKTEWKKLYGTAPSPNQPPPIQKRLLHPDQHWQLHELRQRLEELRPDFLICLGGTAQWAITGDSGISNSRGVIFKTPWGHGISTYHPAAILREYAMRPLAWADLTKGRLFLQQALPKPLRRTIWINPTEAEIRQVYNRFKAQSRKPLGVDIETCPSIDQITCIAFGTETESICLPFWDRHAPAGKPYQTLEAELRMWRWTERFAALPNPKVLQNGLYDMQYLLDAPIPIQLHNAQHDTAILSHALEPELPKALGTLASLYLNEPSWKQMRTAAKDAKVDE